jgi:hypothetical protein
VISNVLYEKLIDKHISLDDVKIISKRLLFDNACEIYLPD